MTKLGMGRKGKEVGKEEDVNQSIRDDDGKLMAPPSLDGVLWVGRAESASRPASPPVPEVTN